MNEFRRFMSYADSIDGILAWGGSLPWRGWWRPLIIRAAFAIISRGARQL